MLGVDRGLGNSSVLVFLASVQSEFTTTANRKQTLSEATKFTQIGLCALCQFFQTTLLYMLKNNRTFSNLPKMCFASPMFLCPTVLNANPRVCC